MRKQITSFVLGIALGLVSLWAYSSFVDHGVEVRFVPFRPGMPAGELIANLDGKWTTITKIGGQTLPTQQ